MNHWERFDRGILMPWYTHGALDEISTWTLAGKVVLEYGGGYSTRWWASRAERVWTVESDPAWYQQISRWGLENVLIDLRDRSLAEEYARVPDGCRPDVAVIDGDHRTACLRAALALPRPLVLVCDNWQQDFVYVDAEAEEMMRSHPGKFYAQGDHKNHAGRPWQTAIWHLPGA